MQFVSAIDHAYAEINHCKFYVSRYFYEEDYLDDLDEPARQLWINTYEYWMNQLTKARDYLYHISPDYRTYMHSTKRDFTSVIAVL